MCRVCRVNKSPLLPVFKGGSYLKVTKDVLHRIPDEDQLTALQWKSYECKKKKKNSLICCCIILHLSHIKHSLANRVLFFPFMSLQSNKHRFTFCIDYREFWTCMLIFYVVYVLCCLCFTSERKLTLYKRRKEFRP